LLASEKSGVRQRSATGIFDFKGGKHMAENQIAMKLWASAEEAFANKDIRTTVHHLEAICQSRKQFLPLIVAKTHVRLAHILLNHTSNAVAARGNLERAVSLMIILHSCFIFFFFDYFMLLFHLIHHFYNFISVDQSNCFLRSCCSKM
jgi:hypothetical protein